MRRRQLLEHLAHQKERAGDDDHRLRQAAGFSQGGAGVVADGHGRLRLDGGAQPGEFARVEITGATSTTLAGEESLLARLS